MDNSIVKLIAKIAVNLMDDSMDNSMIYLTHNPR